MESKYCVILHKNPHTRMEAPTWLQEIMQQNLISHTN